MSDLALHTQTNSFKPFTKQSQLLTTLYKKPFENIMIKGQNAGN